MIRWHKPIKLFSIPLLAGFLLIDIPKPVMAQGNTMDCYRDLTSYGATSQTATAICESYPQYAGNCAESIRSQGGTWETAEYICKYGTVYSAECVQSVRSLGANWNDAQAICGNAIANTSQCVSEAREEDFSWPDIVNECRRPDVADALQNCMNGLMYNSTGKPTGVTAVAAEQECRSGRR